LEAPFSAGEVILPWFEPAAPLGMDVVAGGYRAGTVAPPIEHMKTCISSYDTNRGCYMLQEPVPIGFSGGPIATLSARGTFLLGLIVANYTLEPKRSWMIPGAHITEFLRSFGVHNVQPPSYAALHRYTAYLERQRKPHGLHRGYMDVQCVALPGDARAFSAHDAVVDHILQYSERRSPLCVLGNYGTGKTCVALEVAYSLTTRLILGLQEMLPIYIPLGFWSELPSRGEFLDYLIANNDYPIDSREHLASLAESGLLFLLLDGADEVDKRLDPSSSPEMIERIANLVPSDIGFAILGRMTYFVSMQHIATLFDLDPENIPPALLRQLQKGNFSVMQLQPLRPEQIQEFLVANCGERAGFAGNLIASNYDLPDLAARPVLLRIIAESIERLAQHLKKADEDRVTSADLYEVYVRNWLLSKSRRSKSGIETRMGILEDLALAFIHKGARGIALSELEVVIGEMVEAEEAERFLYDIGNSSVMDLVGMEYRFSHKSFLEFFAARGICRIVVGPMVPGMSPFRDYLSGGSINEITDFLREMLRRRVEKRPSVLSVITRWLDSKDPADRAHAGHLTGHLISATGCEVGREALARAFEVEEEAWPKRSIALACGRAGMMDEFRSYVEDCLPNSPHREVNLRYHLEYYGSVGAVVGALVAHLCSDRYAFLRPVDLLTLRQVCSGECGLGQSAGELVRCCSGIFGVDRSDADMVNRVRDLGVVGVRKALASSGG